MSNLTLIETRLINNTIVDGYYNDVAWFTREQIGSALEYSNPKDAIYRIHNRHSERLNLFSVIDKVSTTDGKYYETYLYNFRGVLEICRWSKQPKADEIMDKLYDMAESVTKKGYYSLLSDNELIDLIKNRARTDLKFLSCINKASIKAEISRELKEIRKTQSSELYLHKNEYTKQEYKNKLYEIWGDDYMSFHKEWEFYLN